MADPKRDRALNLIRTMQDLIDRPTTPQGEKDAAKGRIAALRAKHNITEPVKPAPTQRQRGTTYRPPNNYDERKAASDAAMDRLRRQAEAEAARRRERARQQATEQAREAARRKVAQEEYVRKMRDKDAMGRPLTNAEREEARRDPLGFAQKRDTRTTNQRNQNIHDSWGKGDWYQRNISAEDVAKAADALRNMSRPTGWDTTTKYSAKITGVEEKVSKQGNPMVVIDFTVGAGKPFRGYYVLNNERGLKNLMAIVSTLLGPAATQMSVDQILKSLHGKACTIILNTWTTDEGIENWGVQTVMKPWA